MVFQCIDAMLILPFLIFIAIVSTKEDGGCDTELLLHSGIDLFRHRSVMVWQYPSPLSVQKQYLRQMGMRNDAIVVIILVGHRFIPSLVIRSVETQKGRERFS